MPTIGLSMIVKNEEKLILRCLESVRPLVDFVAISDTGSTDNTPQLIDNFLFEHKLPGILVTDPWIDFASNRNRALLALHQKPVDYVFVIDADDMLEIADGFDIAAFKAGMSADVYDIQVRHASVVHARPQLFRNRPEYKWVGVLHEYLEAPARFTRANVLGLTINASIEGSRNADPDKFKKDAEILEKALKTEKNEYLRARHTFYLAQSYRDSRQDEKALETYLKCAEMGHWDQQVYVSLLEAIRCHIRLNKPFCDDVFILFERAAKAVPGRSEAHHATAFYMRQHSKNKQGAIAAESGVAIKQPPDGLFVEPWVYDYGLLDEFAVNAYWAGAYLASLKANLLLLGGEKTPPDMVRRLATNASVSLDKLLERPATSLVFSD